MTETEVLRRLLDERGVEYETDDTQVDGNGTMYRVTYVKEGYGRTWVYEEPPKCGLLVSYDHDLGAEDAIAATLGAGTCKLTLYEDTGITVCSECGAVQPDDWTVYYCWSCGRRVVEVNE